MDNNDDFPEDGDKTMLRPRPGGRRPGAPGAPPAPGGMPAQPMGNQAPPPSYQPQQDQPGQQARPAPRPVAVPTLDSLKGAGTSPLATAAAPLLVLVSQLRGVPSHADVNGLHSQVIARVQKFEADAAAAGVATEHLAAARYAMCAVLDETVLSTPWGSESIWSTHTLLTTFHKETWGGEKFFQILDRLKQDATRNVDLLELLYLCLALGFEGKYRIQNRGREQLAVVQDELYRLIRQARGEFERQLSPHWKGVEDRRNPLARYVPLWVVASVLVTVLLGLFISFRIGLASTAEPIEAVLSGIGITDVSRLQVASIPNSLRLKPLLAGPEAQGLMTVTENGGITVVTLQGDNLFASGRAEVNPQYGPILTQIAQALDQVPGPVRVVGHTDNVPIRSFRFQSNWELSRERAIDVAEILGESMLVKTRLIPQGVADTQPVAANDTAQGRAMNRRVEIVHTAQAAAQ
ncbi:MAG: type IVB secretion system protein IcmH/DotU [Gammaproteobacteria bacterium]|nr:type IVB secretion system protein IcmH/DotU [Gammaproteobacteria bacterium]